jgi:2-oxoglutarate ferredoxin oxidoreductase subunit alpha
MMVDKRFKKLDLLRKDIIPPELIGPQNYKTLIIGWGSTYQAIREALGNLGTKDVAFLHFNQVYPLHPNTIPYLQKAKKRVIIENWDESIWPAHPAPDRIRHGSENPSVQWLAFFC